MKAKEIVDKIQATLDGIREEAEKFDNGNNTAGTRVRKGLMAIKEWCASGRKSVSTTVNERKDKKK